MPAKELASSNSKGTLAAWHSMDVAHVAELLDVDTSSGLSQDQAQTRLERNGSNELQTTAETRWHQLLLRQFTDALIIVLLLAAVVSLAVGESADAWTIMAIIVLNGTLGFIQEWKAERALKALKQMLSPRCQVIRGGLEQEVNALTLVQGDVVLLETGDRVPADLRIAESLNLKADESALTGESESTGKQSLASDENTSLAERSSMVWMGTAVTSGRGIGIVVGTGADTEFGRIASLTESIVAETTPLQRKLAVVGKQLGIAAMAVSLVVAVMGWMLGKPLIEMFLTGISLAVAVVPEGLPAVVTLTMALGIRAMVRRKALLRRLQAAEGLGATTVICTDKTGTLTQNQMTVKKIWLWSGEIDVTGVGYDPAGHFEVAGEKLDYRQRNDLLMLLETGLHCNHGRLRKDERDWIVAGEPTETALVVASYKAWMSPEKHPHSVREFSFDSARKRMTVVKNAAAGFVAHSKGAVEVLLPRCTRILDGNLVRPIVEEDLARIASANSDMAKGGLRTLAIARRELSGDCLLDEESVESDLTLLGIVGMMDPPREEVPAAIRKAGTAGIQVLMITGDAAQTALAVAGQIGLKASKAISGSELDNLDDDQLLGEMQQQVVFARTTPEHKLRIVKLLQADGHIVGMTGDGVNDAPALKKADIGIAMGKRGTDVAKGAADIVLTDDNFSSIIGAIEEGRRQYDNIQKFVRYLLSSNTGEVVAIFTNILLGGPLILLPVQILWMNLITDGMTAVALGVEPAEKSVMERPPRDPRGAVLDWTGIGMLLGLGSYVGLATLFLFQYYLRSNPVGRVALAQTVAFTGIILIEKANVLNFRTLHSPLSSVGFFTNPWILIAIVVTVGLQCCAVYVPFLQDALHTVPLRWSDWCLMTLVAAPIFVVTQLIHLVFRQNKTAAVV